MRAQLGRATGRWKSTTPSPGVHERNAHCLPSGSRRRRLWHRSDAQGSGPGPRKTPSPPKASTAPLGGNGARHLRGAQHRGAWRRGTFPVVIKTAAEKRADLRDCGLHGLKRALWHDAAAPFFYALSLRPPTLPLSKKSLFVRTHNHIYMPACRFPLISKRVRYPWFGLLRRSFCSTNPEWFRSNGAGTSIIQEVLLITVARIQPPQPLQVA